MAASSTTVQHLASRLAETHDTPRNDLRKLKTALADVLRAHGAAAIRGNRLAFELADDLDLDVEAESTPDDADAPADAGAPPLIFRRETRFRSGLLGSSVPDEALGMAPSASYGPFLDEFGRNVWFDLFRPIALTSVRFAGGSGPALRVPMRRPSAGQTSYSIEAGSAWIASELIARTSALDGYFTGLTIRNGRIELSEPASVSGDDLVVSPSTTVRLHLTLAQAAPKAAPGPAGADAAAAKVQLPKTFDLRFDLNTSQLAAGSAESTAFGCSTRFARTPAAPTWIAVLKQILVPFEARTEDDNPHRFHIGSSQSELCELSGDGLIDAGGTGWLLPAVQVAPAALGAAAGVGAMCVTLRAGVSAQWLGLRNGKTKLPRPAIIAEPGQLTVLDFAAANPEGRVRWDLWRNLKNTHASHIDLRFSAAFPFFFVTSGPNNSEGVFLFCGHRAEVDRPVDANGQPFVIASSLAFAAITQTGARFHAALLDDDLVLDGKAATAESFRRYSVVLRNALFNVSRPRTLVLFGDLEAGRITSGLFALTHDIFLYLPTLPDPYVATYTPFLREPTALASGRPRRALTGFVAWPDRSPLPDDAPDPEDPRALVHYRFSPVLPSIERVAGQTPTFQRGVATFNRDLTERPLERASLRVASPPTVGTLAQARRTAPAFAATQLAKAERTGALGAALAAVPDPRPGARLDTVQQAARSLAANQQDDADANLASESRFKTFAERSGFAGDPLMLLDVSTHADLMGVTVGPALRVARGEGGDRLVRDDVAATQGASDSAGLQIMNMDVVAPAPNLRAATLPQISWEPVVNVPLPFAFNAADSVTTTPGLIVYENDGIPTRIFSESPHPVPIAPLPVTRHFVREFNDAQQPRQMLGVFTLPFGLVAKAEFNRSLAASAQDNARVDFHMPHFGHLHGGLQIQAKAPVSGNPAKVSPEFHGATLQLDNIRWGLFGTPLTGSTLGLTAETIFNNRFKPGGADHHVPVEALELSGYGASMFSDWHDANANTADVSQAKFDVVVGRTSQEIVQVRSIHYPTGAHFVRTITLTRSNNGYIFRSDSGWKAESDGTFDFTYRIDLENLGGELSVANPYAFHTRPVNRVSNIRNIRDFAPAGSFRSSFRLNDPGLPPELKLLSLPQWQKLFNNAASLNHTLDVELQAVLFDADVHLDDIVAGGHSDGATTVVPTRDMLGYVQLSPSKIALPERIFADLLRFQNGSLGGPVDCIVDVAGSGQRMRMQRVDVNPAADATGRPVFVTAARGAPILPADGAWTVVTQKTDTGDVKPIAALESVPLIWPNASPTYLIAHPADAEVPTSKIHYGFVQSTGTQKLLFDIPQFSPGVAKLHSARSYFADAYKLLNSKGVFPNVANAIGLTPAEREVQILGEGLMRMPEHPVDLGALLPASYDYAFIDEPGVLRIYVQYKDTSNTSTKLTLGIDSTTADLAKRWKATLDSMRVVVDLGPFKELMWVDGNFAAHSGISPNYDRPKLQFGPVLQPVVDILQVLATLSGEEFDSGMNVAMSNSADNWEYKFNCSKEIPVIKFPSPEMLTLNPNPPLKLEAGLRVGFYFNEVISVPTDLKQLVPACGAYVEFYGGLQVQCFTLGVASIYGVGQVTLGIAADSKAGITLNMKFGFGAEIVVGLPVVANVSVLYMAEVAVSISDAALDVAGLILFRGSAEICGGLVAIAIQIEAGGSVHTDGDGTSVIAQVTFRIDVCVLWVIDIDVTEHWQEQRQIA